MSVSATANEALRAAREAQPSPTVAGDVMSRAELADAVNGWLNVNTGRPGIVDAHMIGRYERGAVGWPNREYRAALRHVLGVTSDADLGFRPPRRSKPRDVDALSATETAGTDHESVQTPEETERLAGALTGRFRPDSTGVHALADSLAALRHLEDDTTAAHVLPSVQAHQRLADTFTDVGPEAGGLISEISQYLGWLMIPLGRWEESRAHLDRAAVFALQGNDPQRLAQALSFAAYRSMLLGDYRQARHLSDAARRDTRTDPGLRTYMLLQGAEVAAYAGDRAGAVTLLADADTAIDRLPDASELPDGSYWYVPSVLLGHKAFALHALGDTHAARASAAESLATMPPAWARAEWAAQHRRLAGA